MGVRAFAPFAVTAKGKRQCRYDLVNSLNFKVNISRE